MVGLCGHALSGVELPACLPTAPDGQGHRALQAWQRMRVLPPAREAPFDNLGALRWPYPDFEDTDASGAKLGLPR